MPGPRKASAKETEYRLVTILFADVVGSTALGGQLDPETLRLVMDRCLRYMNQAISEFGGTIARLMGDGLLAFFGAPIAHEDDPERAALAAYRIHEKINNFSQELGQPLKVRVGINTGRVLMGEMGGEITSEYTATGTPINLAARFESAAEQASERFYVAEMHRLKGELLQAHSLGGAEAESQYRKAIEVAHSQEAKYFELRAATSLSRLRHGEGKHDEARQILVRLVGWFTEGFDTADILEAKALLS